MVLILLKMMALFQEQNAARQGAPLYGKLQVNSDIEHLFFGLF